MRESDLFPEPQVSNARVLSVLVDLEVPPGSDRSWALDYLSNLLGPDPAVLGFSVLAPSDIAEPIWAAAARAMADGRLGAPARAHTVRPESTYEQEPLLGGDLTAPRPPGSEASP